MNPFSPSDSERENEMKKIMFALAALALFGATESALAEKQTLSLTTRDVTTRTEADTTVGRYYTVALPLPSGVASSSVERAVLEVYLDVDAKPREGLARDVAMLEVFGLTEAFGVSLDTGRLDGATGVARPVALGGGRRVRVDVTRIVRAYLDGSRTNHGLVVGSLTGMREGDFRVVAGRLPGGAVARLHVYTKAEGL